jgi:Tfp pilus assembly protein PilE
MQLHHRIQAHRQDGRAHLQHIQERHDALRNSKFKQNHKLAPTDSKLSELSLSNLRLTTVGPKSASISSSNPEYGSGTPCKSGIAMAAYPYFT